MLESYEYVIVGAGMTADAAANGIRELDTAGSIGIIGDDIDPPYTRPALTKKLWTDPDFRDDDNWLNTFAKTSADIQMQTRVTELDTGGKTVGTESGETIGYGRLLLATGGSPRTLGPASDRVIYFRTFADYRKLRRYSGQARHIVVVGGGYIGIELAAALVQNGTRVTMVFPEQTLGDAQFPDDIACLLHRTFDGHDICLAAGRRVESLQDDGLTATVTLDNEEAIEADAVVVGLGIEPNTELAEHADIPVRNGIVVNDYLATPAPDVYAAGDIAEYPDFRLGQRRVEHVDNARQMGRTAGRILAGSAERYDYTPYFYSTIFDLGYDALGNVSTSMDTREHWLDERQCVVYYLQEGRIEGVLLWNIADRRDDARAVLGAGADAATGTIA